MGRLSRPIQESVTQDPVTPTRGDIQGPGIPESNKKEGVCYAVTNDGVELPVIDVTHPAFAVELSAAELAAQSESFFREQERRGGPTFLRRLILRFALRRSVLWRGLMGASGTFLSGMNTYLLKLGAANLGSGYAGRGDLQIAGSFPVTALRLRLQDTAHMLATGLAGPLSSRPDAPLHLVNIAGGPAADSLNALIISRRANGALLASRRIFIHVLDLQREAPDFGGRALEALQGRDAPLHGLDVTFEFVRYDWRESGALRSFLAGLGGGEKVMAVSSEGGLFEYGSDPDILSNLEVLREAGGGLFVAGSVTRDDPRHRIHRWTRIPVIPRGLAVFGALVHGAGWRIDEAVERPFSDIVRLGRARQP